MMYKQKDFSYDPIKRLEDSNSELLRQDELQFQAPLRPALWLRRLVIGASIGVVTVGGVGILYYLTPSFHKPTHIPVIVADLAPHKIKPLEGETPSIPHQDKTIYKQLSRTHTEEPTTIAQTEPESPQPKAPVFPQDFISSIAEEENAPTEVYPEPEKREAVVLDPLSTKELPSSPSSSLEGEISVSLGDQESIKENAPLEKGFSAEREQTQETSLLPSHPPSLNGEVLKKEEKGPEPEQEAFLMDVQEDLSSQEAEREPDTSSTDSGPPFSSYESGLEVLEPLDIPISGAKGTINAPGIKEGEENQSCKEEYVIQLGSTPHEESAALEWKRLRQQAYTILAPYEPLIRRIDLGRERGVVYSVQVGPLTKDEAESLCSSLEKRKIRCSLLPY